MSRSRRSRRTARRRLKAHTRYGEDRHSKGTAWLNKKNRQRHERQEQQR